jgi:hypothetical protein
VAQITVALANGRHVEFEVDLELEGPAFFVLSVRKCGSSLFNNIAKALTQANQRRFVDVGGTFFLRNVKATDWFRDGALSNLLHPGNVYGGFRNMPVAFQPNNLFRTSPKLLLIRDPRDALVSEFFTNAYSHQVPPPDSDSDEVKRNMEKQREQALQSEIDAWVVSRAAGMGRTMILYKSIAALPSTRIIKYEDFIFRKRDLILTILEHFNWTAEAKLIEQILRWADVRPEKEDPKAFIRRVTPGDHLEKLQPATIEALNRSLQPVLDLFGYPVHAQQCAFGIWDRDRP